MADSAAESPSHSASVDPEEVAKFAALADDWWDSAGKFAPLHKLNPARLTFIRDRIAAHQGRDPLAERPLTGLRVLDIGCGGGLLCEPLTRLGADVTGIDAAEPNVAAAGRAAPPAGRATADPHPPPPTLPRASSRSTPATPAGSPRHSRTSRPRSPSIC